MKVARVRMSARHRKRAIQFREVALEMGGVLIKLGQFMSTRADVMPEEYLEELRRLQDEVSPVSFDLIKRQIESEFGLPLEQIYEYVDPEPLASASLAQAHRAAMLGGRDVVLKVQRPGIEDLIDIDLATFSWVMDGVERFTRFGRRNNVSGLAAEFTRSLGHELDFVRESYNADRFRNNFEGDDSVYVPKIYWEYVTQRVITLEGINGVKINDFDGLAAAGHDREELARLVTKAYLTQVIEHGFFHADPHPGNIFVMPGPVLAFIDFGMVGEVTDVAREELKQLAIGVARKDADEVVKALARLGFLRHGANVSAPKNALSFMFEEYGTLTKADVTFEALEHIQEDLRTIVYEQPFTLPAQFAFLARAIATMVGLATTLDPDFDLAEAAQPELEKLMGNVSSRWLELVKNEAIKVGSSLIKIPGQLDDILGKLQRGDLKVRVDSDELARALRRQSSGSRKQAYAIWGVGTLGGSIALLLSNYAGWGIALGVVSGALFVSTLLPGRRGFPF